MTLRFAINILVSGLFVLLAGCGGGGSGELVSQPAAATRLLAGTVEDGPISGALVEVVDQQGNPVFACGSSGAGRCAQQFDDARGHFSFLIRADIDLSLLELRASGGIDQLTRVDFSRAGVASRPLQLRAPLRLFVGAEQAVAVTPLTTLWRHLSASVATDGEAMTTLQGWLDANGIALSAPSHEVLEVERLNLLLTRMALETGGDDPFAVMAAEAAAATSPLLGEGADANLSLVAEGASSVGPELNDLYQLLLQQGSSEALAASFQSHLLLTELRELVQPTTPDDPAFAANAAYLIRELLDGAGDELVLGGAAGRHLLRFAIYTYQLEDTRVWDLPPDDFAALLEQDRDGVAIPLRSHPQLGALASLQVGIAVELPLTSAELFSGDLLELSRQKREYYYASNISHLYQAKRLVWNIHDDLVNDSVLVEVVDGEARAGRFDEALTLVESQIFQTAERGQAYLRLAEGYTGHDFYSQAFAALVKAEECFDGVVAAKGLASFAATDADAYRELAKWYVNAGYATAAMAIIDRLNRTVAPLLGDQTAIGNLMTASTTVADAFLAQGDLPHALEALEIMHQLAVQIPGSSTRGYAYQVQALISTARRFADIGQATRVGEIWSEIQTLRNDSLTATKTVIYLEDMVVALYAADYVGEAFSLLEALPSGATKTDRSDALKKLANFIALRDGYGAMHPADPGDPALLTALDLISYRMIPDLFNPTVIDTQIEALTSFNSSLGYIAQNLVDAGRFPEARQALLLAEQLVDQLDANAVKLARNAKVNYGYAKLAALYLQMEAADLDQARRVLEKGEAVLPLISNLTHHEKAVAALADLYLDLGDLTRAEELLALVGLQFEVDGYPRVVEAFIRSGDRAGALELIAAFAEAADALYDPASMNDSTLGSTEVKYLVKASGYASQLGAYPLAVQILDRALPTAWDLPAEETSMAKLADIAAGYAVAHAYATGEALAWALPFERYRNQALGAIAQALTERDDFPDCAEATIDLDGDGRPDFFSQQATLSSIAASGLILDGDSDADGTLDSDDRWPYYAALPSRP